MDYITLLAVLFRGTLTTLALFGLIVCFSVPGGFLLSLAGRSRVKPLVWLVNGFVFVMRGTPLMLQLMFVYFGLPFLPIIGPYVAIDNRFAAAVVAFSLNYAAYFAEIFRGGFLAVKQGQYEAAKVLGLNKTQTMLRVIFPQMMRVALPAVCNESMVLIKDTALVNVVGVIDLLEATQGQVDRLASVVPYLFAAVLYLVLNTIMTFVFRALEKKFRYETLHRHNK